ncbi:MAG: cation:proton antiporter [Gemmatimonadota bacterium]|jgi:CPA2 family monovalent cation:H+ antiporter-2
MHDVAFLLMAAASGHLIARALGLPALPFLLLAGIAVGRFAGLSPAVVDETLVVGVTFLLFLDGMELDPRRVRPETRAATLVGAVQFLTLAGIGFLAGTALAFERVEAAWVGLALAASSTLVCVRMLQKRRQMFEPFGRLVLGVLLVQDALVLLTIPVLAGIHSGAAEALRGLGAVLALGALGLVVRRWLAPALLRLADEPEPLMLAAFTVLFTFLGLGRLLELPTVVGAFLAGVALARFPVNSVLSSGLAPVGDFFSALFFTALGALLLVPTPAQLVEALVLALVLPVVTVPVVAVLAERSGLTARSALTAGLLLSQTSEISLVVGLSAMLAGHIGAGTFTVIALVTLVTMVWTPFLGSDRVAWSLLHRHPFRARHVGEAAPEGHVLVVGVGATGMALLEDLVVAGADLVVVDEDPAVLARLERAGVRTVRGDATDPAVLGRAGTPRARVVCSHLGRPRDAERLLAAAGSAPVLVRVFDEEDAEWVRARGGTPFLYSRASADGLVEWYREEREWLDERLGGRIDGAVLSREDGSA